MQSSHPLYPSLPRLEASSKEAADLIRIPRRAATPARKVLGFKIQGLGFKGLGAKGLKVESLGFTGLGLRWTKGSRLYDSNNEKLGH